MARLGILQRTVYRYRERVQVGEHHFMCRPRDSHELRLIETGISIRPTATQRWIHDVIGNPVLVATTPSGRAGSREPEERLRHGSKSVEENNR